MSGLCPASSLILLRMGSLMDMLKLNYVRVGKNDCQSAAELHCCARVVCADGVGVSLRYQNILLLGGQLFASLPLSPDQLGLVYDVITTFYDTSKAPVKK